MSEKFQWSISKQIFLPNEEKIALIWGYLHGLPLHDANHNIFRLNAQGEVVWQVRREEKDELTLEQVNKNWQAIGQGEWREPFMGFGLVHSDGRTESGDSLVWQPGCVVKVVSSIGHDYELDVEQGLIVNLNPGQRPW